MRSQAKMFAAVRDALSTAVGWLEMGEQFPDRAWSARWQAKCRKEADDAKDRARWYLQRIRREREWWAQ